MLAMLVLAMAQSVTGPPGDEDVIARPIIAPRHCIRNGDDILVCAGGGNSDRLTVLPDPEPRQIFKPAMVQISPNARAGLRAGASSNPMITAPRAMVDLTINF